MRSFCFYRLNDMLERYETKSKVMGPAKRKMILTKIEKLASKPLLTKEDVEIKTKHLAESVKKGKDSSDSKNVIKFDTKFAASTGNLESVRKQLLIEKFQGSFKIFEELENDLRPVSEKEFVEVYMVRNSIDYESAVKVASGDRRWHPRSSKSWKRQECL